ncbi:DUF1963 domain-containing protein [Paenibacillus sp. LHD-38]|nr:DUF1963 domain-containing protein [Paenibacillus sp. LHD-38]MDQ8738394.1 DUF1963 domain-containing protein [Paenibacillus sp. LHD-38]
MLEHLLMQRDSETGTGWGDEGRLYFWIREQDFAELNFEHVWVILQYT